MILLFECLRISDVYVSENSILDDVKVTEAMKTLAAMWKQLPPETKMEYQKVADGDKSRYYAEMKDYTGPMQVPNKRQKKPPGAPKRAMSAFLSFSQQMRPQVRAKYPDMKNTDISGVLAQLWREGTEEEKAPHISRELREREKYHEDMVKWKEEVSRQAEIDANKAAAAKEAQSRIAELDRMGLSASSSLGGSDINFVPTMGNSISSSGSSVPSDSNDFFQNVWMDDGWSAVDKLLQDAERDDPGMLSGNVRQDFFGGRSSDRYNPRDQIFNVPIDQQSLKMRPPQPPFLPSQQSIQRSLPPMMPPLQQVQAMDANTSLNHEANTLLKYTVPSYSMNTSGSSSSNLSGGNSRVDWRGMPQVQYLNPTNPFYEQQSQQQFYPLQNEMIDNRNMFSNNTYNFENFQQQQMMFQQQQQQQQQMMMQQQHQQELQRRYQQQYEQQPR